MHDILKKFSFFLLIISILFLIHIKPASAQLDNNFNEIRKKLVADGFNKSFIDSIYDAPEVLMDLSIVRLFFVIKESKLNYEQFTAPELIRRASQYLETHKKFFNIAENVYGVDPTVIAGIILVETRLGTSLGNYLIVSSLSSIASLISSDVREAIWKQIYHRGDYTREKFDDRAYKKAAWAYGELKAFLIYTLREKKDPLSIYGSYAGAIGICQFLPSNVLTLAVDGNDDGEINLFHHADAIVSVANYLKYHGWKPSIPEKKAFQVIYRYNNSTPYVNTILTISNLLKGDK